MSGFTRLIVEVHRRSLWQVLGIYLVGGWIAFEVIQTLTEGLGLPDWFPALALVLLIVMLPVVLATACVQEGVGKRETSGTVPPFVAGPGPAPESREARERESAQPAESVAAEVGGVRRVLTWRHSVIAGVLAFAILGLAVSGYMAMRLLGIGPVGTLVAKGILDPRERIVLADFENYTNDSTLGLLVTEAFRVDISQSPVVRIAEQGYVSQVRGRMQIDPDAPLDQELAREVAIREGLPVVIAGAIHPAGSGYLLSARIVSAESADELSAFRETAANPDDFIDAINRLSHALRERVGESLTTIRASGPLARVTTSSLDALRKYSQAIRAFEFEGDVDKGIALLEEATAIDTTFAMAYRKLGVELGNNAEQRARMVEVLTKAYEHRDRLTERERYLTLAAYYSGVTGERDRSMTALSSLLDLDPDDDWALTNLAWRNTELGNYERAEELARRAIEVDSASTYAYYNVATALMAQGRFDEARATLEALNERAPDHVYTAFFAAGVEASAGNYDVAERYVRVLREAGASSLLLRAQADEDLAALLKLRGRLAVAEEYQRDMMAVQEQRGLPDESLQAAAGLTLLEVLRGRPERGIQILETALQGHPLDSIAPLDRPYMLLSWTFASCGRPDLARALLAEHDAEIEPRFRRVYEPWRHGVAGWIALAEGQPQDAVAEFREFDSTADRIECGHCALAGLGYAYEEAGLADSAIAAYERYANTPWPFRYYWDAQYLAFVYERLGTLYEERDDRQKATYYYGKLVELWQDADRELQPRVEAARRAIVALSPDT